jgi:formate hydrogenlyase subunit 3/multisubunit Na+/H+ antiporter MnhD subunit
MTNLPPLIPIIFLLLGALAVGASNLARLNRPTLVMIITSLAALAILLTVQHTEPTTQIVAAWQPVSVFTVPLSFRVDQAAWLIALGFMLILTATAFTWRAYPGRQRPAPRALSLLLIAAAIAGVFASNLLTLAIAWGVLDLIFVSALLLRSGPEVGRRAALAIVFNVSSTVCVWIAALLIENQANSLYWHLFNAQEGPRLWLTAAAVLRIGLYPFHQWLPVELSREPDRSVLLFTVPSAAGLALWTRMTLAHALPSESIVLPLSIFSALVGAGLAWRAPQPRAGLPYVALGLSGLVVLGAPTHAQPGVMIAATLNWMFMLTSLFISRDLIRQKPYWSAGVFVAILSLAGLPGTLGFAMLQPLYAHLVGNKQWLLLAACALAEAGFIATTVRLLLKYSEESLPQGWHRQASWGLAIAIGAVPLILLVFLPEAIPGLPAVGDMLSNLSLIGLIAMLASIGLGVYGAWRAQTAASRSKPTSTSRTITWQAVLRLEWLNNVLFYSIDVLTGVLRAVARVIEGEGGLLWTLALVVIALVLYSEALK